MYWIIWNSWNYSKNNADFLGTLKRTTCSRQSCLINQSINQSINRTNGCSCSGFGSSWAYGLKWYVDCLISQVAALYLLLIAFPFFVITLLYRLLRNLSAKELVKTTHGCRQLQMKVPRRAELAASSARTSGMRRDDENIPDGPDPTMCRGSWLTGWPTESRFFSARDDFRTVNVFLCLVDAFW